MTSSQTQTALFAGGCFWCIGADFKKAPSIVSAVSGYAGGATEHPTYENYAAGGHREVVEVAYDASRTPHKDLVVYFLRHIDPTDASGSFHDRGLEYAPAIYYESAEERRGAEEAIAEVDAAGVFQRPLAVALLPRPRFWPAEEYHQDYEKKNPDAYARYRRASGRDEFFKKVNETELQKKLSPEAYRVLREGGTEAPFSGKLLHEKRDGAYRCAACGAALFSSDAKFDSGTGWPSFDRALPGAVRESRDTSAGMERVEITCANCGSHLGHLFDDGPTKTGTRYCLNSVCLGFDERGAV